MGLFDKAKNLAKGRGDKLGGTIDKAADTVDEKTGGKYSDKIDKAADAARNALDDQNPDQPPRRTAP